MSFLASLPREKKVKVISVSGPYRTGKSFLLNRFLDQMKGFEIGQSVESCTKGIWIWNKTITLKKEPDHRQSKKGNEEDDFVTVLIDTEGLNSSERSADADLKIFALTVLLSSSFIFNQMGPITEQALSDLGLIVNLVKFFGAGQSEYGNENNPGPRFYWCLRDFYHDIEEDFK